MVRTIHEDRGEIFYSDGRALGVNEKTFTIYAVTKDIASAVHARYAEALSPLIGKSIEELKVLLDGSADARYVPLAHGVAPESAERVALLHLAGIGQFADVRRAYPDGSDTAAISGFLGWEGKGEVGSDRRVGRYGTEEYLEDLLAGVAGSAEADRDGLGRWIPTGERVLEKPQPGTDVFLTIERPVQQVACTKLQEYAKRLKPNRGTLIVLDPRSGGIIALCTTPTYDPNAYGKVEEASLFLNDAVSRAYEPGSVFKPLTMALGLEVGVVKPETTYSDTGNVNIGKHVIKNAREKVYGKQDMVGVLKNSINTGAVFVARALGHDRFRSGVEAFGFGKATGVELAGEALGDTSALENSSDIYTATASFGQGIAVTPMQLLQAFGAIANGGELLRPRLIESKRLPDGTREKLKSDRIRRVVSERTAALVRGMLVAVVKEGHAKRAGVKGYRIGGKTGTAQVAKKSTLGYSDETIHTFIGMGPIEAPRFVILVKLDNPKGVEFAESSAAPLAGELAQFLLEYWKIPPSE